MADQTREIIIVVILLITTVGLLLAFGHLVYLDFYGNRCGQNSSGPHIDKTQDKTIDIDQTTECDQEDQTFINVTLLNDQYSV
jgi:hypothetical protein